MVHADQQTPTPLHTSSALPFCPPPPACCTTLAPLHNSAPLPSPKFSPPLPLSVPHHPCPSAHSPSLSFCIPHQCISSPQPACTPPQPFSSACLTSPGVQRCRACDVCRGGRAGHQFRLVGGGVVKSARAKNRVVGPSKMRLGQLLTGWGWPSCLQEHVHKGGQR